MVELGKALLGLGLLLVVTGAAVLIAARSDCRWDGYPAMSPNRGKNVTAFLPLGNLEPD